MTVKIWKNDDAYDECLSTLKHNNCVNSILQLKGKEILVSSCGNSDHSSNRGVSFWNINNYTQQHFIKGYCVDWFTHMIELSNGNIALSSDKEPYPIIIIDITSHQVKKEIKVREYVNCFSSLCVFN